MAAEVAAGVALVMVRAAVLVAARVLLVDGGVRRCLAPSVLQQLPHHAVRQMAQSPSPLVLSVQRQQLPPPWHRRSWRPKDSC